MSLISNPLFSQMVRERSPILKTHAASAVLSEDAHTIRLFMSFLEETTKAEFRRQALTLLREVREQGYVDPKFREKVAVLEERGG